VQVGPSEVQLRAERDPLFAVSGAVASLVRERWGRGPTRCRAHWAGPDALLVLLDDTHTQAERTLRDGGHAAEVLAARRHLCDVVEPDLRRIVEHATHRPVRTYLAGSDLDPDVTALVFAFGPG
jgi:uncharacterized protein YbcI